MSGEQDRDALVEWWPTFDGPAYPSGEEVADAILASDWLADLIRRERASALRKFKESVLGPSEDLRDVGTCLSIANDIEDLLRADREGER